MLRIVTFCLLVVTFATMSHATKAFPHPPDGVRRLLLHCSLGDFMTENAIGGFDNMTDENWLTFGKNCQGIIQQRAKDACPCVHLPHLQLSGHVERATNTLNEFVAKNNLTAARINVTEAMNASVADGLKALESFFDAFLTEFDILKKVNLTGEDVQTHWLTTRRLIHDNLQHVDRNRLNFTAPPSMHQDECSCAHYFHEAMLTVARSFAYGKVANSDLDRRPRPQLRNGLNRFSKAAGLNLPREPAHGSLRLFTLSNSIMGRPNMSQTD